MRKNMLLKIPTGKLNTATAMRMGEYVQGTEDEPDYLHEILYRTKRGQFFFHAAGGPESKYVEWTKAGEARPGERIVPLKDEQARAWMDEHLTDEQRRNADHFANDRKMRTYRFPNDLYKRLKEYCETEQVQMGSVVSAAILDYVDSRRDEKDGGEAYSYRVGDDVTWNSYKISENAIKELEKYCMRTKVQKNSLATLAVHEYLRKKEASMHRDAV